MELGNMLFGNSRGEAPIPRSPAWEGPWEEFCEELKVNWRGYADEGCLVPETGRGLETDIFLVRSYDWDAECDCGVSDKMDAWHEANDHADNCYQAELRGRIQAWKDETDYDRIEKLAFGSDHSVFSGFDNEVTQDGPVTTIISQPRKDAAMEVWRKAHDAKGEFERKVYDELCKKHGLSEYGCAVHCTCSYEPRAEAYWNELGGHSEGCRLIQPNFLYKPTGLRINWYKYPFRDSYMSPKISAKEWRSIIRNCIESATAPSSHAPTLD